MSKTLSGRPHLDWYRKAAKQTARTLRARDPKVKLAAAQLAVARQHGHASWRKLKEAVESQAALVDSTTFIEFIRKTNVKAAAGMLKASPGLANVRDAEGATVLLLAVEYNKPAMVKLLLDQGADVTARYDGSAHTPLSWAMTVGAFKSAAVLLKAGVKPDLFCAAGLNAVDQLKAFFDDRGYAIADSSTTGSSRYDAKGQLLKSPPDDPVERASDALYIAARNGQAEAVRFLLTKKIDLTFRGYSGGTPLHWASWAGSAEVTRLLLAAGADPADRNNHFAATPRAFGICVAANWGNMTLLKRRLREDPSLVNIADARGTPLHEAARSGHLGIARTLLAAGADPQLQDAEGKRPAELAEANGHAELVKLLTPPPGTADSYADHANAFLDLAVPQRSEDHRSGSHKLAAAVLRKQPGVADANLYTAAVLGRHATIARLLKRDPRAATRPGGPRDWQPLSYLAFSRFLKHEPQREKGFLKSAKLLLSAGADANTYWLEKPEDPKSQKESVLYGAAGVANHTPLTKLLLEAGANPNDGESVYHACEFNNHDVLKLLHDAGVAPDTWSYCLLHKLDFDDFAGAKWMLDRGADPNHRHPGNGRAALHWAIMRRRSLKFIQAIHSAGGDPNLADKEGLTPFALAMRLGRTDVAAYLLKQGAVDRRDEIDQFVDAAVAGDAKTVRTMIKRAPKLLASLTPAQFAALPGAAAAGNVVGVKALLDLGIPIDTPGDWGGSALHQAAWHDQPAVVKLLIQRGARIDVRTQWGGDALHTALHAAKTEHRQHSAKIVRTLIKSGQVKNVQRYLPEDSNEPGAKKVIKLLTPYLPEHSDDPADGRTARKP